MEIVIYTLQKSCLWLQVWPVAEIMMTSVPLNDDCGAVEWCDSSLTKFPNYVLTAGSWGEQRSRGMSCFSWYSSAQCMWSALLGFCLTKVRALPAAVVQRDSVGYNQVLEQHFKLLDKPHWFWLLVYWSRGWHFVRAWTSAITSTKQLEFLSCLLFLKLLKLYF